MDVYLIDGTYELFRHFFALPPHSNPNGEEVSATRGVLRSLVSMLESGVTHIGVATDHVIESFRNQLWADYKTSAGVNAHLLSQFQLLEDALTSMGIIVWPMVELEADDALAGAAASLSRFPEVRRLYICSPDKDLAQCVRDNRVVQLNRRTGHVRNEEGVCEKFGVSPTSIPDYLALTGDSADGYPGLAGWGERSAATILNMYNHLENIPPRSEEWQVRIRNDVTLAETLQRGFRLALLFRDLATLRTGEPVIASVDEVYWRGPAPNFAQVCERLDAPQLVNRLTEVKPGRQSISRQNPRD